PRARGDDPAARCRRPARGRHRVLPPGRPAAEVGPRVDGRLARAALAVPRPPGSRARARSAAGAGVREGGAQAGLRRRPAARDRRPPQERVRRPARPLVPAGAAPRSGRPAPLARPRSLPAPRARAAAPRARRRARRPRAPSLVPLHARALAAHVRRRRPARRLPRRCVTRRRAYAVVLAACVLPRLAVLLHERSGILDNMEKSDALARVLLKTGTFGYVPGEPSANTQPLYGWFLWLVYWLAGKHWWSVGGAQLLVAAATALVVYEIGRRRFSARVGLVAALAATLQPYLVWHDVHGNREILDQLLGAAMFGLALVARRPLTGAALGLVTGLAILSNSRLVLLPVVFAVYLLWQPTASRITKTLAAL